MRLSQVAVCCAFGSNPILRILGVPVFFLGAPHFSASQASVGAEPVRPVATAVGKSIDARSTITDADQPVAGQMHFRSAAGDLTFDSRFPGGKVDELIEVDENRFEIVIRPEMEPINDSAWYAFRVRADRKRELLVRLRYQGGTHRYQPKLSHDGCHWESAEELVVARHPAGREVTLRLSVGQDALWVAGQELCGTSAIDDWITKILASPHATTSSIGNSVRGQPLRAVEIADGIPSDSIFILSRQHPPEVTGTIGMMSFVDALVADDPVANEFRKQFRTLVVPIANPDGVRHGHWRTNANGVDLNRDWMHFTQPETRAIRDEMLRLRADGRLWLFLDFHSTYEEVFYTPPRETPLFPPRFTSQWLAALDQQMPDFDVIRDDSHNAHRSTSKSWVARELGIHAVTYEFGDETARPRIHRIARHSANEMMKLLLDRKRDLRANVSPNRLSSAQTGRPVMAGQSELEGFRLD